jgi:hypothetical protein
MKTIALDNFKKIFSWKRLMTFWYRHYKIMFFVGFVVVLLMVAYLWYANLYQYRWSEERKKEFIETNYKATTFKEKAFQQLVSRLKDRDVRHDKSFMLSRDIFTGKSL